MAEIDFPRNRTKRARLDYVVETLSDPERIRAILRPRIEYTAYALGQLEPGLFERARWFWAKGDTGTGLVLHSRGGLGDATFMMGDSDAVRAILSIYPGTAQTYSTCQPQHLDVLRSVYRLASQQPMIRMSVTRETFQPVVKAGLVNLSGLDIRRINGLYSSEGNGSYYVPEHIDAGTYRGVVCEGRLVAIAGTHVVSPQEHVAVVGNVFTHPMYRGRGFATLVTSAVTESLLEYCNPVVLTVDPSNLPAVRAYERLGYHEVCQLVEASAARQDVSGFGAWSRRLRASIRGKRYGGAFVSLRSQ